MARSEGHKRRRVRVGGEGCGGMPTPLSRCMSRSRVQATDVDQEALEDIGATERIHPVGPWGFVETGVGVLEGGRRAGAAGAARGRRGSGKGVARGRRGAGAWAGGEQGSGSLDIGDPARLRPEEGCGTAGWRLR